MHNFERSRKVVAWILQRYDVPKIAQEKIGALFAELLEIPPLIRFDEYTREADLILAGNRGFILVTIPAPALHHH